MIPPTIATIPGLRHLPITAACSGIYFLCIGDEVVYVGQSANIMSRVATHIREDRKEFDLERVFFFPCPIESLDETEIELIERLRPRCNRGKSPPFWNRRAAIINNDLSPVVPPIEPFKGGLWSIVQVAEFAGVDEETVRQWWRETADFPRPRRLFSRILRWDSHKVYAWLKKQPVAK